MARQGVSLKFRQDIIERERQMWYNISEIVGIVYMREYLVEDINTHHGQNAVVNHKFLMIMVRFIWLEVSTATDNWN